jgi:hypothetical protein
MQAPGTNHRGAGTDVSGNPGKTFDRRWWLAAAGWVLLIAVLWGTDLLAKLGENEQGVLGKDPFRLISEQVTSGLAVLIMIPFVLRWLQTFPLRRDAWAPAVIGHTVGTLLFAFGHHSLMVAMRIPWYALNGMDYVWREPFVANLIVEFQKDIKIYLGIIAVATAWGLLRRSRGESDQAPEPESLELPLTGGGAPPTDRLVVQTGRGTSVLRFDQIDYLEAARNYVSVHADGREYVVRDTMANLSEKLAPGPFVRTHRSYIVNADKIAEIRTADARQRIVLRDGAELPLSRSYREAVERDLSGPRSSP